MIAAATTECPLTLNRVRAEFLDWGRLFLPSFRRRPESRCFGFAVRVKMDAGLRRHDKFSLRLKVRDFKHP